MEIKRLLVNHVRQVQVLINMLLSHWQTLADFDIFRVEIEFVNNLPKTIIILLIKLNMNMFLGRFLMQSRLTVNMGQNILNTSVFPMKVRLLLNFVTKACNTIS